MSIVVSLSQDISCEYICSRIQKLIDKNKETISQQNSILIIEIKEAIEYKEPQKNLPFYDSLT